MIGDGSGKGGGNAGRPLGGKGGIPPRTTSKVKVFFEDLEDIALNVVVVNDANQVIGIVDVVDDLV